MIYHRLLEHILSARVSYLTKFSQPTLFSRRSVATSRTPLNCSQRFLSTEVAKERLHRIERMLECMENNRRCADIYCLVRAPYLCSTSGMDNRFLAVLDRWWRITWPIIRGDAVANKTTKPTSTVFHLGLLNQQHNGAVVRTLGPESVAALLDISSSIDFCSLPDRMDVLSYLTGICGLIRGPKSDRIAYPSLKPISEKFCRNLKRYLAMKSKVRKDLYDKNRENGNGNLDDEWIFMITVESYCMFGELQELQLDFSLLVRHGDDLIMRLCKLAKFGFEYYRKQPSVPEDEKDKLRYRMSCYAGSWLYWGCDPEKWVPGSWRSWYGVFRLARNKPGLISNIPSPEILHYLKYLNYMQQVAYRFHCEDILPLFVNWLSDLVQSFRYLCASDIKESGICADERIDCLTDVIYSTGRFSKFASERRHPEIIHQLIPVFPIIATDFLKLPDLGHMRDEALWRYLTGLRDFKTSAGQKFHYSVDFTKKLQSLVNGFFARKCGLLQVGQSEEWLAYYAASTTIILRQLNLLPNADLWSLLSKLFEIGFVGKSSTLFQSDALKFCKCLAQFGDSCWNLASSPRFRINDRLWLEFFSGAKMFLEKVDPGVYGDRDPSTGSVKHVASPDSVADSNITLDEYKYLVLVVLSVARRFDRIDEFERLKSIWEQRMFQILPELDSRASYLTARKMKALCNRHGVVFDQRLLFSLRERGTDYVKRIKAAR